MTAGTYEHVDLVFTNGGPFDPANYGGDADKALKVRQAFLKSIPRQDIVDRLIKPINPDADAARVVHPGPGCAELRRDRRSQRHGRHTTGRHPEAPSSCWPRPASPDRSTCGCMYAANNPRRANEYDLMKASAAQAGFNLIDGQSPSWCRSCRASNRYDASLFGWQTTSIGLAESQAELRDRRREQLRQVLQPGRRRRLQEAAEHAAGRG